MPESLAQMFAAAQARAKAAPGDLLARSSLWQIFAARGEYARARTQLDMMLKLDASWALEVQGCHALLDAEELRNSVFNGTAAPVFLGEPPEWFGPMAAALPLLASGQRDAASSLLTSALEMAPSHSGALNGIRFEWICDGDARLGPCLEVIAQGRYIWVDFKSIRRLIAEPPKELRDLIWLSAKLEIDDSGALDVFLPVRYPRPDSDEHMLARQTDWEQLLGETYLGHGQKCLSTDADMVGLLDLRELCVDVAN